MRDSRRKTHAQKSGRERQLTSLKFVSGVRGVEIALNWSWGQLVGEEKKCSRILSVSSLVLKIKLRNITGAKHIAGFYVGPS